MSGGNIQVSRFSELLAGAYKTYQALFISVLQMDTDGYRVAKHCVLCAVGCNLK